MYSYYNVNSLTGHWKDAYDVFCGFSESLCSRWTMGTDYGDDLVIL